MKYDKFYGSVPLIGVEVEVQGYKDTDSFAAVRTKLVDRQFTLSEFEVTHEWHCKCRNCTIIGSTVMYPVQWTPQYDGSLPYIDGREDGIEWISSIFPVLPIFTDAAKEAIRVMTKNAFWKHGLQDKYKRPSYPSFHVHCSLDTSVIPAYYINQPFLKEVQRTFREFYPELIALASTCGYIRKNLFFRSPEYLAPHDGKEHHIFIAPAAEHYEWRIWEAPPNDPDYYESAMYVSASLTQASLNYKVLRVLEGVGLVRPSPRGFETAEEYLPHVDSKRLEALRIAATECSTVVANPQGVEAINRIFEKARVMYL